jgi:hypothetical protein
MDGVGASHVARVRSSTQPGLERGGAGTSRVQSKPVTARRRLARQLRSLLAGEARRAVPGEFWREQRQVLAQAAVLVRVYYASMLFIVLMQHPNWDEWLRLEQLRPMWPVAWLEWVSVRAGITSVLIFTPVALLAATLAPQRRMARSVAFVGVLQFAAFWNSFGFIGHGWHGWLWISFLLIFLPDGSPMRLAATTSRTQTYLRVFWSAQAALLFFYTLSGLFKLGAAAIQFWDAQVTGLHPEALSRHIAYRLLEAGDPRISYVGHHIVEHPWIGWPIHLSAIYLETFALVVAFRPALHRLWGAGLILMHAGIFLALDISFVWQVQLVALMLLASPFAPACDNWRDAANAALVDLPVFGDLWRWKLGRGAERAG